MGKKRILMILFVCATIIGCSRQPDNSVNEEINVDSSTQEYSLQTEEEISEENQTLNIVKGTGFHDGVAIIETEDNRRLAIDKEGKILFELSGDNQILFFEGVASDGDTLIDKNGNIVASPDKNGYTGLLSPYCEGYALAYYLEEGYPDSIIQIGVLNGDGEWVVPLSENHKILKEMEKAGNDLMPHAYSIPEVIPNIKASTAVIDDQNIIYLQAYYYGAGEAVGFSDYYGNGFFSIHLNAFDFYYNAQTDEILYEAEKIRSPYEIYIKNGTMKQEKEKELDTIFDVYGDGYYAKHMLNDVGTSFFCVYDETGNEMFKPIQIDASSDHYDCVCIVSA